MKTGFEAFKEVLEDALIFYKDNFYELAKIVVAIWLPANILINGLYYMEYINEDSIESTLRSVKIISNIAEFLHPLESAAILSFMILLRNGESIGLASSLRRGLEYYGKILWANIVAGFFILLGFIALIIPGLYLATKYSLVDCVVMFQASNEKKPYQVSYILTKQYFWPIFGSFAFVYLGFFMLTSIVMFIPIETTSPSGVLALACWDTGIDVFFSLRIVLAFFWFSKLVFETHGDNSSNEVFPNSRKEV